ncbi:hypothetical protein N7509_000168 [Penicillium cosmopolitanum]|uniref:Uncharacterized protein n=1 Tax=Penicillium cosmopolitanum TaxID=1131564 RepID=A0A9W9WCC5_9EURO|nr:uncharacterized protein N7509_000168 [Penicillium cosmopolitanum]KAJ5414834.1 hypothetical protein N7509_000168 [Penicillium cosmopolitanum]
MPSSSKSIDTNLSQINIDESSNCIHLARENKPDPHDYYMYLLRAEQGRDKDTRRSSLLAQKATAKKNTFSFSFEPLPYEILWEADFLTHFKAHPKRIVIFQVLPIPDTRPFREKKLVLGFNFATNELLGYTLEPTNLPIEEIHAHPNIWRECRDSQALTKSWPHRVKVITISTTRFQEMIEFTTEYFGEFGGDMVRDGILHFFKETSTPMHGSLDLVVVIQLAQFLADFVHLLEDDWEQARALLEKYDAFHEFLRDLLLRTSVDVWLTSYGLLKVGMGKGVVSEEERERIQLLIEEKVREQNKQESRDQGRSRSRSRSRNHQQPYIQDAEREKNTAQQYLQQGVYLQDATRGRGLSDIYPTPAGDGRGQQDVGMVSEFQHGLYATTYEWHWYPWFILAVVFIVCAWLFGNQMYWHFVAFMACLFVLCFVVTTGDENNSFLTLLANILFLPSIYAWMSDLVGRWDLWYLDILAALAAMELLIYGQRELLVEEALLWVTIRVVILICRRRGVDIDSLFRPGWMGRVWRWVVDCLPYWLFDSTVHWSKWYTLGLDCTWVLSSLYFMYTEDYTPLARGVLLWCVLRYLVATLEDWKDRYLEFLLPYLEEYIAILYLPYGFLVLWAIVQQQFKLPMSGLSLMVVVHWVASRIWKLAQRGHKAKAISIWIFVAWRACRVGYSGFGLEADYFALAVFARWISRVRVKDGYNFVFLFFGIVLVWRVYAAMIETMMMPVDILVFFCMDWLSVTLMEWGASPVRKNSSKSSPWNEHLLDIHSTPTTLRRVTSWGEERAD